MGLLFGRPSDAARAQIRPLRIQSESADREPLRFDVMIEVLEGPDAEQVWPLESGIPGLRAAQRSLDWHTADRAGRPVRLWLRVSR